MKEKLKEKIRNQLKETKIKWIVLAIVLGTIGFLIGFEYIFIIIFIFIFLYLAKQGEKEHPIAPWEQEEKVKELEKMEKKAEIIREHIKEQNDLEAKLKLHELEEEMQQFKQKNKIK